MGRRRRAREDALQLLYAIDLGGNTVHQALEDFREARRSVDAFTEYLVYETVRQRADIDALLEQNMDHWTIDRLATIDRCLLRLAMAEIICCVDVPTKVTINEYIEVAKKFSDLDSPRFVNGVLDKAARDQELVSTRKRLRPPKPPEPTEDD